MQRSWGYYLALVKRWIWVAIVGIVVCGTGTYLITKFETPIYQASAVIIINVTPATSGNTMANIAVAPTYAQLVPNPSVLQPVLARHPGLTLQQLNAMMTVTAQPNTELVEIDIQNSDPQLATQLANEISQSFIQYASTQLPGTLQVLPAQLPTIPVKPKPLQDTALGAVVGLALAIALIAVFEWVDGRLRSPEEVQQVLDMEVMAVVPYISRRKGRKESILVEEPGLVEVYRTLCANLNAEQAKRPFKLLMVTSSQASDGKSKTSANIASFLAVTGKRVLLVDTDLHRPVQAQQFQLDNRIGLSSAFMQTPVNIRFVLNGQVTSIPTLHVLTAGVLPPNPAELFQSSLGKQLFNYFRAEAPFDYIIFDTPPLLALADAQILASMVDATILVTDVDKTPRRMLLQVKRILKKNGIRTLGVVINKCRWPEYRKQTSSYYYYSKDREQPEIDTSLVLYPGYALPTMGMPLITSAPNSAMPPDAPPSSNIPVSVNGNGSHPVIHASQWSGERANQNGGFVPDPRSWPRDPSGMGS